MREPKISLVVPFYNEEACAREVVHSLAEALHAVQPEFELLLIENASSDGTRDILRREAAADARLKVIELNVNIGYGGAVLKGLGLGSGEWLGFTCGDGEISSVDVAWLASVAADSKVDFYKAKRLDRRDGAWRKLLSLGYHFIVGAMFGVHVTDINGYPVLIRKKVYNRLKLTRSNWVFNVELLLRLRETGVRVAEVDVPHRERLGGSSHVRFWTPVVFLLQLFSLWLEERRGAQGAS